MGLNAKPVTFKPYRLKINDVAVSVDFSAAAAAAVADFFGSGFDFAGAVDHFAAAVAAAGW